MNRLLKPERLDVDPNSPTAAKEWKYWHRTFTNFIDECGTDAPDKYRTIKNFMSHTVFDYVEDCSDYDAVVSTLQKLYVKSPNEIFARHLLATRRQQSGESLDAYLQQLHKLSKDCNLKPVSAEQYKEQLVRDSFINGLLSPLIRQRLLENKTLTLEQAFDQASSLDLAQKNANAYSQPSAVATIAPSQPSQSSPPDAYEQSALAATHQNMSCFFCGGAFHPRPKCPARDATCNYCETKGHFSKVCMSKKKRSTPKTVASMYSPSLCAIGVTAAFPQSLSHAAVNVEIAGVTVNALIDSCSSDSFISQQLANKLNLNISSSTQNISMALSSLVQLLLDLVLWI